MHPPPVTVDSIMHMHMTYACDTQTDSLLSLLSCPLFPFSSLPSDLSLMRHKHIHSNSVEGQTFFTDSYPPDNLTFALSHTCLKSKRRKEETEQFEDTHKHISPPTASQRRRTFSYPQTARSTHTIILTYSPGLIDFLVLVFCTKNFPSSCAH